MIPYFDENPVLDYSKAVKELCGLYSLCSRAAGTPAERSERMRGAIDMVGAIYSVNTKDVRTDMKAELLLGNVEFDVDEDEGDLF